jgi:uncharacterized protein YndB with AHSA1/START domain
MEAAKTVITVSVVVNTPIEKVWNYFTTPAHIMQWNNASPDWHTPNAMNDFNVGKRFVYTMAAKDGSFSFDFGGVYTTIEAQKHFAYTMDDDRKAEVSFSSENNVTTVVEKFEAEAVNSIEMQEAGWQAILNNFKQYTETH